jgi:hypothetical protein
MSASGSAVFSLGSTRNVSNRERRTNRRSGYRSARYRPAESNRSGVRPPLVHPCGNVVRPSLGARVKVTSRGFCANAADAKRPTTKAGVGNRIQVRDAEALQIAQILSNGAVLHATGSLCGAPDKACYLYPQNEKRASSCNRCGWIYRGCTHSRIPPPGIRQGACRRRQADGRVVPEVRRCREPFAGSEPARELPKGRRRGVSDL